jgi:hypothetical protein
MVNWVLEIQSSPTELEDAAELLDTLEDETELDETLEEETLLEDTELEDTLDEDFAELDDETLELDFAEELLDTASGRPKHFTLSICKEPVEPEASWICQLNAFARVRTLPID